jgi:hypothetical protein
MQSFSFSKRIGRPVAERNTPRLLPSQAFGKSG